MNTSVGSGALCTSPKGETTYFHSDMLDKSDFIIPKKILWKDVEFPENWILLMLFQPLHSVLKVLNKLFNILMEEENWFSPTLSDILVALEFLFMNPLELQALPSQPFYSEENESTQESQQDESPVMSPTYSQMINTISLSDEDFEINKDLLRKDFYSEVNKQRNDWFFSTVPKVIRTIYQEEFYVYLRQEKKNIKFWIWFELFKQEEYPDYPCKRINNTSTKAKIWKTSDNIVIESIHPPEAKIEKNINGTIVTASPFKTKPEDKGTASATDIRRIMEQINYTNMFLITLGNQVNRVEEIIETQDHLKKPFVKNDNKPLFKPFELSKKFQENPQIDQAFIDRISQKDISPKAKDNGLIRIGFYHSSPKKEDFEEVLESSQDNSDKINAYLNTISAALNCLQEGLVPTQFYEKTRQALFGANGKKLIIKYKLSNAHICNQGICIKQTFILVKDLKEKALLGVPFLSSIFPMWVDDQGIRTKLLDKEILFEFANPPGERSINTIKDQVIKAKQNHINLLNKRLLWKQHEVELPYEPDFNSVEQHWKHLNKFVETVKSNGLSLSATKINLFQTKVLVEFLSKEVIIKNCWIHKIMAPKTEKQSFKKSSSYMKPHSVLSEKFKPLYYDFASGSTSDPNPPVLKHPSSPVVEEGNISGSLPLVEEPSP
ncbi:hypothetical protein CK203_025224 [Vitis vinifera]|uniref:DUF7588 domain-containing protein n=1 Tax=Vitis vinifera TaxID=29760 RepID=A0A438JES1_VITVI|nr:hypothetical protein CK203_025224 [Vitis vinifera]